MRNGDFFHFSLFAHFAHTEAIPWSMTMVNAMSDQLSADCPLFLPFVRGGWEG